MKAGMLVAAALALALAIAFRNRGAAPAPSGPRAVVGTVEIRLGAVVQRYAVRIERGPAGFVPALRPLGLTGLSVGVMTRLPLVRDRARPPIPLVIETPQGSVEARVAYRPLGPWHVLERAIATFRIRTAAGERTLDFEVTLRDPALEG